MIEFHDVHKSFGSLEVLKGINLKIEKSQVVTLIGPSGSGKSTILRCMNLLERPTSGQVFIEGQDITAPKTDIQKIRKLPLGRQLRTGAQSACVDIVFQFLCQGKIKRFFITL